MWFPQFHPTPLTSFNFYEKMWYNNINMKDLYTYIFWLQVFANMVSVIVTYKIGRLGVTPSFQWFTFSASLMMALLYRILKVLLTIPNFAFIQTHKVGLNILGDVILLPLTAFFIMVFVIQVYLLIKKRN